MGMPAHIGGMRSRYGSSSRHRGTPIGDSRTEQGEAARLRNDIAGCLAASATISRQPSPADSWSPSPASFVTNDLMRLPLGILTGVGFIDAGVYCGDALVRDDHWTVPRRRPNRASVAATAIALVALWLFDRVRSRPRRECHATLCLELEGASPSESQIRRMLETAGLAIARTQIALSAARKHRELLFDLLAYRSRMRLRIRPLSKRLRRKRGWQGWNGNGYSDRCRHRRMSVGAWADLSMIEPIRVRLGVLRVSCSARRRSRGV
jgi:putative Mg2+ transporter-C (MgtC) family protein